MDAEKFDSIITSKINNLNHKSQLEFMIQIAEKMYPDYEEFCNSNDCGNPKILFKTIKSISESINHPFEISEIKNMLSEIDLIIPDTENFESINASYALNSGTVVEEILRFLINPNSNHIQNVITYYTDTIDFKIYEKQNNLTDEEINIHPQMIEARHFLIKIAE